jgi:hypothetical protein
LKYQCQEQACGKTFIHPARKTVTQTTSTTADDTFQETNIETTICPHCGSLNITEAPTEKQGIDLNDVVSLKDCPPNEADQYLQQGYMLYQAWQKNVFLVKLKEPTPEMSTSQS